jgi:hypothetical protein
VLGLGPIARALALALRFDGPWARRAGVSALVLVAAGYLAAPLRHAGGHREREDVREIRGLLESGFFQNGRVLSREDQLYAYVRLYQSFSDRLDVRYDPASRVLSLREKRAAP